MEATRALHLRCGSPENWEIITGSILDDYFVDSKLANRFDVVYSYGVLHHTGSTSRAIFNAGRSLSYHGVLHIALYPNEWVEGIEARLERTQEYSRANLQRKYELEVAQAHTLFAHAFHYLVDPFEMVDGIGARGMDFWVDLRDAIGGWPLDFLWVHDVIDFAKTVMDLETVRYRLNKILTKINH